MYQVGINKGIILRCTAYQISRNAQLFDKLSHSCSGVPILSVTSVAFDAEVFWRQLLGFLHITKWLHSFSVTSAWYFCS